MAVRIARFTTFTPEPIELLDGKEYACRQISAIGYDLVKRIADSDDSVTGDEIIDVVCDLLGAPRAEVERLSIPQLFQILRHASVPAEQMQAAVQDDAKNDEGGPVATPRPPKPTTRGSSRSTR